MIQPRKPFLALVLSFIPGLGQIYNGQLVKGIIFILADLLLPVLFKLSGTLLHFNGLMAMVSIGVVFIIYRLLDGFVVARKLQLYHLRFFNKEYVYVVFAFAFMGIRVFLDAPTSTGIQTYRIPTASMVPTLLPGDRLVAQIDAYKNSKIEYGDIVVYNSPKGGIWIHRVIGLPLDSVELLDGNVYINGKMNEATQIGKFTSNDPESIVFKEHLSNKKEISTLRFKTELFDSRSMPKKLIPEGEYFLMGDSRDNSLDSRFLGTIKQEDILGRAIYTYWGLTADRRDVDLRLK